MHLAFHGIHVLDGYATTADNVAGRVPEFMLAAGFEEVSETRRYSTMYGTPTLANTQSLCPHGWPSVAAEYLGGW